MGALEAIADPSCVVPLFSKRVLVHSLSYENEFSFTKPPAVLIGETDVKRQPRAMNGQIRVP